MAAAGAAEPPRLSTGEVLRAEFDRIHSNAVWCELDAGKKKEVTGQNTAADADQAAQLAAYYQSVHALPGGQTALCLSGGGIRSAAFCMGILQGLARRKLLGKFHYLSTVSGGGYIGSWLTAWAHRNAENPTANGFAGVEDAGAHLPPGVEDMVAGRPAFAMRERGPVEWLRGHQRYLNPDSRLTSPDLWAPIALLIRDLLLNWLVFLPLILAVLLVPRILEFVLIWWGYTNSGSAFGAVFTHVFPQGSAMLPPSATTGATTGATAGATTGAMAGATTGAMADAVTGWTNWLFGWWAWFPGWTGCLDAAGAALVLVAAVTATRNRLKGERSDMNDAGFRRRVLSFMLAGGVLLTMFTAALAIRAPDVDLVLLKEWTSGTAVTLVVARVVARCLEPDRRRLRGLWTFVGECVVLAISGVATGVVVWGLLKLRAQFGMTERVGVRDLAALGIPLLLLAYIVGQVVYAGLTSRADHGREDQEWLARASGHYLLVAVIWAAASPLVLFSGELYQLYAKEISAASGALTLASAMSAFSLATSAMKASRIQLSVTKLAMLACVVFVASGTVVLSHATARLVELPRWGGDLESGQTLSFMALERESRIELPPASAPNCVAAVPDGQSGDDQFNGIVASCAASRAVLAIALAVVLAAMSACASFFVDVNLFSLHALYRNRLVRSFIGASSANTRSRNRFSGFSNKDDIAMQDLWTDPGTPRQPGTHGRHGPFPVVNMAINLAPSADLARQQRQASSFIATPLHVGGDVVGYRGHADASVTPITLGTAMAISGAAFNANWGYHTSPLVRFVMMLFNVRLGWWLRNPNAPVRRAGMFDSFWLLLQETFGLLSVKGRHVYLSDGGHFDNLGLFEMLRRRCRTIVVVDASQDYDMTLEDLGRSLRNAAADMGITVTFGDLQMTKRTDPPAPGVYCAVGKIVYPECREWGCAAGQIVYIKPGFYKDSPADVRAYAASNARFPHDTTLNQWFTESQFESYRTLGSHVLTAMFKEDLVQVADLPKRAEEYIVAAALGSKPAGAAGLAAG